MACMADMCMGRGAHSPGFLNPLMPSRTPVFWGAGHSSPAGVHPRFASAGRHFSDDMFARFRCPGTSIFDMRRGLARRFGKGPLSGLLQAWNSPMWKYLTRKPPLKRNAGLVSGSIPQVEEVQSLTAPLNLFPQDSADGFTFSACVLVAKRTPSPVLPWRGQDTCRHGFAVRCTQYASSALREGDVEWPTVCIHVLGKPLRSCISRYTVGTAHRGIARALNTSNGCSHARFRQVRQGCRNPLRRTSSGG
jgi:hypothetical protein